MSVSYLAQVGFQNYEYSQAAGLRQTRQRSGSTYTKATKPSLMQLYEHRRVLDQRQLTPVHPCI